MIKSILHVFPLSDSIKVIAYFVYSSVCHQPVTMQSLWFIMCVHLIFILHNTQIQAMSPPVHPFKGDN